MAASGNKRVVVVRFDREPVAGFFDPAQPPANGQLELLTPGGEIAMLPETDIKALCFVRDLDSFPGWKPNRTFAVRPKTEGLWVRFTLRDGDQIDGLLPGNLLAWDTTGFSISPPDPGFFTQRIYLPRKAVTETRLMGVVGAQQRSTRKPKAAPGQLEMFDR